MKNTQFYEKLCDAVRNPKQKSYRRFFDFAKSERITEQQLLNLIETEYGHRNWHSQSLLVFLASRFSLSSECVPVFCKLLDEANPLINNEDIVDMISDYCDKRAVPSLRRSLLKKFPHDEYSHMVNRKAIWGLGKIGTYESLEALKFAMNSSHYEIREDALEEIILLTRNLRRD